MVSFWRIVTLAGVLGSLNDPTCAETVAAHRDAYFYAAPRAYARVLDEVQREAKLEIESCESGWCRVRYGDAEGYVRDEVVHGPANVVLPDEHASDTACFRAAQPGGGTWQTERFCRSGP